MYNNGCPSLISRMVSVDVKHHVYLLIIAEQYKCHVCCICKKHRGKVMEDGEKKSLHHFSADQKIASSRRKCVLGHLIARATSYCLLPDIFSLRAFENAFKDGTEIFANSLSPPSILKEREKKEKREKRKGRTENKSGQGT